MDAPLPTAPVIALISPAAVMTLIRATISSGAPLYGKGYQALCTAIYASAARTIHMATGPSASTKALACSGLARAATGTEPEKAWALRRAFDAILADLEGTPRQQESHYPLHAQGSWLPSVGSTECTSAFPSSSKTVEEETKDGVSAMVWILIGAAAVVGIAVGACAVSLCIRARSRKRSFGANNSMRFESPQQQDLETCNPVVVVGHPIGKNPESENDTVDGSTDRHMGA
jgi:multisubunit Na+/H+ antiporter MnhC subunit